MVERAADRLVLNGRPHRLAADSPLQAEIGHQALYGATGHRDVLPVELPPDLPDAVASKFSAKTRWISGFILWSRFARADSFAGSARLARWS